MMLCWILISLFVGFLKAEEVIYAQVGGTVILPRQVLKDERDVYVNWYRGADLVPAISRNPQGGIQKEKETKTHAELLPDFSLKISPVQNSDFVTWRCLQHILLLNSEKTYKLYNVTIPKVPAVMAGGSLSLECKADSSPVNPKVTWIPPKNPDCYLTPYIFDTKTGTITDASRCHNGVWTCKLEYGDKRITEATTTVSVIDLSSSPDTIYTAYPSSSSTVNIPCFLSSNIPWSDLESDLIGGNWSFTPLSGQKSRQSLLNLRIKQVVRWDTVEGTVPTVKGRELKDNDLSIHNLDVSEKIRGEYSCNLMFTTKTLSRKVKVEVLILSSSARSPVQEGKSVNLTCTLGYQHSSDLEVKWNCSSCSYVSSLKSPHPSFLYIPEVKLKDKGKYTCELWKNGKKLTSAMLLLKTEKAPVDIWLCVAVSGGIVGFILLVVIIIIFIRKRRQTTMYRRRKTKFCCCKNPQKNQKGFYKT